MGEPARELPSRAIDGAIAAPGERMPQPDLERTSRPGKPARASQEPGKPDGPPGAGSRPGRGAKPEQAGHGAKLAHPGRSGSRPGRRQPDGPRKPEAGPTAGSSSFIFFSSCLLNRGIFS